MTTDLEKKQQHAHEHVHGPNCTHDEVSDHEEHSSSSESDGEGEEDGKILNRNEKKARKLMSKMGLKPVADIERVTIKRARMIFAIANPTVYKSGDSFVVFGEAKVEDQGFQAQAMAAQRLAMAAQQEAASEKEKMPEEAEDEEEVDAEGCDEKDIRIVMEQTGVPRSKAVAALKANNNDIVNTIMELTM
jgi:nascent polypeptide-associated complex subunit alpha